MAEVGPETLDPTDSPVRSRALLAFNGSFESDRTASAPDVADRPCRITIVSDTSDFACYRSMDPETAPDSRLITASSFSKIVGLVAVVAGSSPRVGRFGLGPWSGLHPFTVYDEIRNRFAIQNREDVFDGLDTHADQCLFTERRAMRAQDDPRLAGEW